MTRRMDRINALIRQEISLILSREVTDRRLATVVSITRVETTADLKNARVFVSVLGDTNEKRRSIKALRSATGFIHRQLKTNLTLRAIPHLLFKLDESIEREAELFALIAKTDEDTGSRQ